MRMERDASRVGKSLSQHLGPEKRLKAPHTSWLGPAETANLDPPNLDATLQLLWGLSGALTQLLGQESQEPGLKLMVDYKQRPNQHDTPNPQNKGP